MTMMQSRYIDSQGFVCSFQAVLLFFDDLVKGSNQAVQLTYSPQGKMIVITRGARNYVFKEHTANFNFGQ